MTKDHPNYYHLMLNALHTVLSQSIDPLAQSIAQTALNRVEGPKT
jgi:hypothetical protein